MSYGEINVQQFTGLNSNVSTELIQDGMARDLYNFRMEKIGKLVSRDSSIVGLTVDTRRTSDADPNYPDETEYGNDVRIRAYQYNGGVIGMGELILEEKWDRYDSDRFMVYVVRGEFDPDQVHRHKQVFLLSPVSGRYKNELIVWQYTFNGEGDNDLADQVDQLPMGNMENTTQLMAPNRLLPGNDMTDPDVQGHDSRTNAQFIDNYITMNQYRHKLVISDRTNGDMLLEDEFERKDIDPWLYDENADRYDHKLHLRPNALAEFDVDVVDIDPRTSIDQENNSAAGVENGMGLYGYELDKSTYKASIDNFADKIGNEDWYYVFDNGDISADQIDAYIVDGDKTSFLTMVNYEMARTLQGNAFDNLKYLNKDLSYRFTNVPEPGEYPDASKPLIYASEETLTEDGEIKKVYSADVYIWNDFRLKYYPCNGVDYVGLNYFMRAIDRQFEKLQKGIVRSFELEEKVNAGNGVPLGVWRYRYVWDFGNGIYSAPSAEMLCPDMLWSAVPNRYADDSGVYNSADQSYERYINLEGEDFESPSDPVQPPFTGVFWVGDPIVPLYKPKIFNSSFELTQFGELLFTLKQKVYEGMDHRFAGHTATTVADLNALDWIKKGEFATLITLHFGDKQVKTQGWIWEGAAVEHNGGGWEGVLGSQWNKPVYAAKGQLIVPLFQVATMNRTFNSVFDDHGRYRKTYRDTEAGSFSYQLMFPWQNDNYPIFNQVDEVDQIIFFTNNGEDSGLYFNIVSHVWDENNNETSTWNINTDINLLRPNTILRGVRKEADKLGFFADGIPSEAVARLVLNGSYPLTLIEEGEKAGFMSEIVRIGTGSSTQTTDHADVRTYYAVSSYDPATDVKAPQDIDNLEVVIYGDADRFIGVEQLSSYFPSSLLFRAPRIGIKIKAEDVPLKAKKLLIFRTKSSHSNDWDPHVYGLVEEVEIKRDSQYNVITDMVDTPNTPYTGLYFFDDIKDDKLDYGVDIGDYEGLRTPLKSAFNIALNERMYYLNFTESYQPIMPRKNEYSESVENGVVRNTNFGVRDSEDDTGYTNAVSVRYRYIYELKSQDGASIMSMYKETPQIQVDGTSTPKVVVFWYLPSQYDSSIISLKIYREKSSRPQKYYYIGEVKPEDEGIFVDNDLVDGALMPSTDPDVQNYESGMRWSEPYRPDWIKADSFAEYRSGDGKQITGVDSQYGNLVIFKETSIHRVAVQGQEIPLSRTDEVTPEIGLIAPLAKVNVNNMLYFLSWKGLMMYDNNVLQPIDAAFQDELQFVMRNAGENIRDASCGYNSRYSEIYLNVPMLPTEATYNKQDIYGTAPFHEHTRTHYGHIYVVNLEKQYATKFGNFPSRFNPGDRNIDGQQYWLRTIGDTRQLIRMYYNNSLGEMRSADILPMYYGSTHMDSNDDPYGDGYSWAGVYIETPYNVSNIIYRDTDEIMDIRPISALVTKATSNWADDIVAAWDWNTMHFPPVMDVPIYNMYKSKFFTGNDEMKSKRIRKTLVNVYAAGPITLSGIVIPEEDYDERIDNLSFIMANQTFNYPPSRTSLDPLSGALLAGTDKNILSFIPQHPFRIVTNQNDTAMRAYDDFLGKPIRYSVEVSASGRTQLNAIIIYYRPINTYLR
jgi:hypothetical protein